MDQIPELMSKLISPSDDSDEAETKNSEEEERKSDSIEALTDHSNKEPIEKDHSYYEDSDNLPPEMKSDDSKDILESDQIYSTQEKQHSEKDQSYYEGSEYNEQEPKEELPTNPVFQYDYQSSDKAKSYYDLSDDNELKMKQEEETKPDELNISDHGHHEPASSEYQPYYDASEDVEAPSKIEDKASTSTPLISLFGEKSSGRNNKKEDSDLDEAKIESKAPATPSTPSLNLNNNKNPGREQSNSDASDNTGRKSNTEESPTVSTPLLKLFNNQVSDRNIANPEEQVTPVLSSDLPYLGVQSNEDLNVKKEEANLDMDHLSSRPLMGSRPRTNTDSPEDSDHEDEDNNQPISLGIRQPSFSSLCGQVILKNGEVANTLPTLDDDEDKILVLTEEAEEPKQLGLHARQSSYASLALQVPKGYANPHKYQSRNEDGKMGRPSLDYINDDNLTMEEKLAKRNEGRWKELGFDPNIMQRNYTIQNFQVDSLFAPKTNTNYRNSSCANFYPTTFETPIEESPPQPTKKTSTLVRVNSSGTKQMDQLVVPMPTQTYDDDEEEEEYLLNDGWRPTSISASNYISSNEPTNGIPSNFHLDFTEIKETQGYDSEQGSQRIPERLAKLVTEKKESLTYLALCGVSIVGYQEKAINKTIADLKYYLNMCISKGYLDESAYVQSILDNIKFERELLENQKAYEKLDSARATELYTMAKDELDMEAQQWENKMCELETEEELAINELKLRYKDERDELDKLWNSKRKKIKFNKPSPKLIEMRHQAQQMMKSHRFEEAAWLSEKIDVKQAAEEQEASFQMQLAYEQSVKKLENKFRIEAQTIETSYTRRKNMIERQKTQNLKPVERRVDISQKNLENLQETKKRTKSPAKVRGLKYPPTVKPLRPGSTLEPQSKLKIGKVLTLPKSQLNLRPQTSAKTKKFQTTARSFKKNSRLYGDY